MQQLVEFGQLFSGLSTSERNTFNQKCIELFQNNANILEDVIAGYFMYKVKQKNPKQNPNALNINELNAIIKGILEQRKPTTESHDQKNNEKENDDKEDTMKLQINDLNQNVITEIASFLPLQSYVMFECVNRNIFVTIRNAPTLNALIRFSDLELIEKYTKILSNHQQILFMQRFNKVKKLKINPRNFYCIKVVKWKNVKELTLACDLLKVQSVIKTNMFSWNSINKLRIVDIYYHKNRKIVTNSALIFDLFCKFPNIQYLCLGLNTEEMTQPYYDKLCEVPYQLKELKHLCLVMIPKMNLFLMHLCNQLQSLHLSLTDWNINIYPSFNESAFEFMTLKKLHLDSWNPLRMVNVIKKTKELTFLRIDGLHERDSFDGFTDLMEQIFELKSLKTLIMPELPSKFIHLIIESITKFVESSDECFGLTIIMMFNQWCGVSKKEVSNTAPQLQKLSDLMDKFSDKFEISMRFFDNKNYAKIANKMSVWRQETELIVEMKDTSIRKITVSSDSIEVDRTEGCECCNNENMFLS